MLKTLINGLVSKMQSFRGNWNQSDPTASDYIKNRPFYTETRLTEILPETEWVGDPDQNGQAVLPNLITLEVGKTYTVNYNGMDYECVVIDGTEIGIPIPVWVLGNLSLMTGGENTGEPFVMAVYPPEVAEWQLFAIMLVPIDGSTSGTLSISGKTEYTKKIDKKFLPPMTEGNFVSYTKAQNLTSSQQEIARENIGAFDGNYYSLTNLPTLFSGRYSDLFGKPTLFSGSYNDLTDKPEIPDLSDIVMPCIPLNGPVIEWDGDIVNRIALRFGTDFYYYIESLNYSDYINYINYMDSIYFEKCNANGESRSYTYFKVSRNWSYDNRGSYSVRYNGHFAIVYDSTDVEIKSGIYFVRNSQSSTVSSFTSRAILPRFVADKAYSFTDGFVISKPAVGGGTGDYQVFRIGVGNDGSLTATEIGGKSYMIT